MRRNEKLSILVVVGTIAPLFMAAYIGFIEWSLVTGAFVTVLVGSSIAAIIWGFKPRFERKQEEISKFEKNLRVHHEGIISRMEQWVYEPSESGDMLFISSPMHFISGGERVYTRMSALENPQRLKEDLKHLKEFKEAWEFYSNGMKLYNDFKTTDREATNLVKDNLRIIITGRGLSFQNWTTDTNCSLISSKERKIIHQPSLHDVP